MTTVLLGIGSNLGDRQENIRRALMLVNERTPITKISPFFRTAPAEGASGGYFLNGAAECRTRLSPAGLHKFLRGIEEKLGRPADHEPAKARPIDLDILFFGRRVVRRKGLAIPHPRLYRRYFVLKPLAGIAPDFQDPVSGKTVRELFLSLRGMLLHDEVI